MGVDWPIVKCRNTGCHIWVGDFDPSGYGVIEGRAAHRVAVERSGRLIFPYEHVDHVCCVTMCVNPDHLEIVSRSENIARLHEMVALGMQTVCMNGHVRKVGSRCRECLPGPKKRKARVPRRSTGSGSSDVWAVRSIAELGISQAEFSRLAGVTPMMVSRWASGSEPSGPCVALLRLLRDRPELLVLLRGYMDEEL